MATLTFPTLSRNPSQFTFGIISNTMVYTSPLSGTIQTVEMPAARWKFSFSMDNLEEADAVLLQGFLAQSRGQAGRFYFGNLARPAPRGIATGTPLVKGASQTGVTLITDGWTINTTGILKVGDFFGVNGELKMVVSADVNSNGTGDATIIFEPPLRSSPADNAPITIALPKAIFKLTGDDNSWNVQAPVWSSFSLQGIEVL